MSPDVITILATALVYFFLILAFKVFGKKELSQLTVIDLVFILLISNAVQNAMVNGDWHSFVMGILAATTLFVLNYIFKRLQYRFHWFRKIMGDSATILVKDGIKQADNLKKEEVTEDELMAVIREHGVDKIKEVKLAVLEADGNISVVSFDHDKTTIVSRRKRKVPYRVERD
jgi:uncharacterized membrane protein YcaP (DUF421 family)